MLADQQGRRDRERVRGRAARNGADQRRIFADRRQADGVRAGDRRIKDLAANQRPKSVAEAHRR